MERIVYHITLDTHKGGTQKILQGFIVGEAVSRRIEINLVSSGMPYPLSEGASFAMFVLKEGAVTPSVNECEIRDNTVIYDVLPTDIDTEGITQMQFRVTENGRILCSCLFELEVTKPITDDTTPTTSPTYTALEKALEDARTVYRSRLVSIDLDDDLIFHAYYGDGTSYESDALQKALDMSDLEALLQEAREIKSEIETIVDTVVEAKNSAVDSAQIAENFAISAESSELNAKASERIAYESANSAELAKNVAVESAEYASASEAVVKSSADNARLSETNASLSEANASASASNAYTSEVSARRSEQSASASESKAKTSEVNAKGSEENASASEGRARLSEINASASASSARTSEINARTYEGNASTSASLAKESEDSAEVYAREARESSEAVVNLGNVAKSYAVGGTSTREGEDSDNAKYYYEQAKGIATGLGGSLLPMGTIPFAELENQTKESGYMYNISDNFVSTASFKDGGGRSYSAGSNVYYTADGFWDVLSGTSVFGVKGSAETEFRTGNVEITKDNIGLSNVDNTADADKSVAHADTAGDADTLNGKTASDFADVNHTHTPASIGASAIGHTHTTSDITDFPTSLPASDVSAWAKADEKPAYTASEVGASPIGHTHDDRYYTEDEMTALLNGKADSVHNQSASSITSGTFGGDIVAPASANYSTAKVCNINILDTEPTEGASSPYPNGTISFVRK